MMQMYLNETEAELVGQKTAQSADITVTTSVAAVTVLKTVEWTFS